MDIYNSTVNSMNNDNISLVSDVESDGWNMVSDNWEDYDGTAGTTASTHLEPEVKPQRVKRELEEESKNVKKIKTAKSNEEPEKAIKMKKQNEDQNSNGSDDKCEGNTMSWYQQYFDTMTAYTSEIPPFYKNMIKYSLSGFFIYYTFTLFRNAYYEYKIDNMIGTVDELPVEYIDLQIAKCNNVYSEYCDLFDECLDSETDNNICLQKYSQLIHKNAKFCNWDHDQLYKDQQVNMLIRNSLDTFDEYACKVGSMFKSVGSLLVDTGSKQLENVKYYQPIVADSINNGVSNLVQLEQDTVEYVGKSIEDAKLGDKWEEFVAGSRKVFDATQKGVTKYSKLVYEGSQQLASNGAEFAGEHINKKNLVMIKYSIGNAAGNAYNGILRFVQGFNN